MIRVFYILCIIYWIVSISNMVIYKSLFYSIVLIILSFECILILFLMVGFLDSMVYNKMEFVYLFGDLI